MVDVSPPACDPALLASAGALVGRAAELALEGFRRPDLAVDRKGDGTVVTAYDRAVERLLREGIAAELPDDGIVGEEEDDVAGTSGRRWILDPIDGTSPYTRGVVTWGVLVACEDEHGPLLGVVACPWADLTVIAGRGLGSTEDGRPARASGRTDLAGAVLATSGIEWWPPGAFERVSGAGVTVRTWGNAYGLALAATGRVDAFFDAEVHPWDVAPAPVLMAEAGGCFATLDGSGSIDAGTALLCGEPLLEPLLAVLRG
jgi:fructose-1,6-bisphosphatase/inositol monophosphatase family enzyme